MNLYNRLLPWFPPVLWMAIIFTFSSFQAAHTTATYWPDFVFKKTIHVTEYSILWWLLLRACNSAFPKRSRLSNGITALIITILYAISDELHQTFTPSREGTLRDVIIDSFGAGVSFWIYMSLRKFNYTSKFLNK